MSYRYAGPATKLGKKTWEENLGRDAVVPRMAVSHRLPPSLMLAALTRDPTSLTPYVCQPWVRCPMAPRSLTDAFFQIACSDLQCANEEQISFDQPEDPRRIVAVKQGHIVLTIKRALITDPVFRWLFSCEHRSCAAEICNTTIRPISDLPEPKCLAGTAPRGSATRGLKRLGNRQAYYRNH